MAPSDKITPVTTTWFIFSRTTQILGSIIVMALDIYVITEWNQNKYDFNLAAGNSIYQLKTFVGGTPFTGITMFTAVLTLFAIFYDVTAPKNAMLFYHIYGEIVLELFLIVFWMTSFAGMASYVSEIHGISDVVSQVAKDIYGLYGDLGTNTRASENCCIVIAVLGAMIFAISLGNFMTLIAYVVQHANRPTQASTGEVSYPPQDPEQTAGQPQMPHSFAGVQEIEPKP